MTKNAVAKAITYHTWANGDHCSYPEPVASGLTGLDWDGTASVRRQLFFPNPLAKYPATFLLKVFQRQQVTVGDGSARYYTNFFHGNNGRFDWGTGYDRSYYGAHPYPIPSNTGDGKWEISTSAQDFVTRDDSSSPYAVMDQWYSQAFRANLSGGTYEHKFYIDLPSVALADTITHTTTVAEAIPPSPSIVIGQTGVWPFNDQLSWGGYPRWEETNAILRGWQIYDVALSEAHILALSALDTDAAVLAKCTELGISAPWWLCMNPTPDDVTDKSGNGNHFSWDGAGRPALWEG